MILVFFIACSDHSNSDSPLVEYSVVIQDPDGGRWDYDPADVAVYELSGPQCLTTTWVEFGASSDQSPPYAGGELGWAGTAVTLVSLAPSIFWDTDLPQINYLIEGTITVREHTDVRLVVDITGGRTCRAVDDTDQGPIDVCEPQAAPAVVTVMGDNVSQRGIVTGGRPGWGLDAVSGEAVCGHWSAN